MTFGLVGAYFLFGQTLDDDFYWLLPRIPHLLAERREAAPMPMDKVMALSTRATEIRFLTPSLASRNYLVRARYSSVRVSISILSPISTKAGTWMTCPVASRAGFMTLPEVSPLTAGSV